MLKPPFKLALSPVVSTVAAANSSYRLLECCDPADAADEPTAPVRARLAQLDPHLHCSIIGTCLSTAELRKLIARFLDVDRASDLDVHHEAVRLATQGGVAAKAINKALDQRHDAALQRFARTHDAAELERLWDESVSKGEVPGAYWAVLTHRSATPGLRQKAFGDVHMLSHLVGSSNRADMRRLAALEGEIAELRERLERQQSRALEALDEHETVVSELRRALTEARASVAQQQAMIVPAADRRRGELTAELVATHTERRERAEQAAAAALADAVRLGLELEHAHRQNETLGRELAAAEIELRAESEDAAVESAAATALQGRRILYVGGRPSSTPAIRSFVSRHGGEFQRHDGGLEDRKGLLASAVAWSQLVVFPVDCVDHDSAGNLKRLCARHGIPFLALRTAGVASLAAALAVPAAGADGGGPVACTKKG